MLTTILGIGLSLWSIGGIGGLLLRFGLLPAVLQGIPMLVNVLSFALDAAMGALRLLGKVFVVANANPVVYTGLMVAFLTGAVYGNWWTPFVKPKAVAAVEKTERKAKSAVSAKKDGMTSVFDDIRCNLGIC